ncbi:hypothetical protein GLOTRDRAFT_113054 [Gloeophyllum trabeum ATCC 11539]|uniref:DUF7721 domain-containing protein n=1 Tax=Gloeophyllum trabeum (strain ATCC 11539 / FP-39264 / Madison 617) TaxID=670483 RepID=S7QKS4_GLOTA|nr:uncharacterized protein GLOTRDRAFT_113054 [Gloeophyllum trabeum ATCC 11539]EPQ60406.1 hypothetical protein GLOTRDRAFT_113054 [Gloeophyllum trabeum ATCC 11539]
MDNIMNLAKQGYQAYSESQSNNVNKTGGQEYNSPHHSNQGQGGYNDGPDIDHDEAVRTATSQGSGDSSLFSSAMSFLSNNKTEHQQPVDEQGVQDAHRKVYQEGDGSGMDASALGGAAALQALKSFTSSGGSSSGGGNMQTKLISMAMAEATQLFDSKGAVSGNKQDAVNSAAMTVMKLLVQSKFSGTTGGGNSGGLGSLMGLASKFM